MTTHPQLAEALGHTFARPELLDRALSHRSWAHDRTPAVEDNERLEFLGDAVLGLVIAEHFVRTFPNQDEGRLSTARAGIVQATSLARHARRLGLGEHVRLSRGEEEQGGRDKPSILSDVFEAVLGAIYRDGGLDAARSFVLRVMADDLSRRAPDGGPHLSLNPKGQLQELLQAGQKGTPRYEVLEQTGPQHDPTFRVAVFIGDQQLGTGEGRRRKEAEEFAARAALDGLEARA